MAQALHSLGAQETTMLVRQDRLLERTEPFAGELLANSFGAAGIDVRFGRSVTRVERPVPGGPVTVYADDGSRLGADEILVAIGRRPNLYDIGLETVGLEPKGPIEVDASMRATGVPEGWLYAVGDANGRNPLTHMGKYQARVCADVIAARANGQPDDGLAMRDTADDRGAPQVIFTDPEICAVGRTEARARADGFAVRVVEYDIGTVIGAALAADGYTGRAKAVVDEDRHVLLGITFVGPGVVDHLHAATIARSLRSGVPASARKWQSGGVSTTARAAVALLPSGPGVYRFRDDRNRTLYIGRAANLRRRVGSYWADLGDRPHLARMVPRTCRIEAAVCDTEHEAAWLERSLLERQIPPWNRTAGGQEVEVCIRLDASGGSPGLSVVHTSVVHASGGPASGGPASGGPASGGPASNGRSGSGSAAVRYFGPYLGGARVRMATAGLHRIFPLQYAADAPTGTMRDLARHQGVSGADRSSLAGSVAAILDRDPAAITALRLQLTARRAIAARAQAYELAGRIHAELAAIEWVTCAQRIATLDGQDAEVAGWASGVLVRFEIRAGRMCGWQQLRRTQAQAQPRLAASPPRWQDFAYRNAVLAAALARAG
jgi:Pyridine nucleotide-disulphide oxidoreductase/Pyridine nucleotide-disulphide oxidoreductase, dimerisation domain/GIY-YIG catalytic domain